MKRILLQTTIPYTEDDCSTGRFSLLANHLCSLTDDSANGFIRWSLEIARLILTASIRFSMNLTN